MSVFSGLAGRLPRALPSSRAMPSRYRWLNAILAAAVVGLGVGAYFTVNSSSTPATLASIRTAAVTRGVVLSSVSATGNIEAASQLSVDFRTSGTISAVNVKVGQHVKAGQILGRLDPTVAKAGVTEAEASLKTAQANLQLTLTGETADQRAADALGIRQARAQITTAIAGVATAKQQQKQDAAAALTSIAQAERQVSTDLGTERTAVAQLKTDLGTNANLAAAEAAVTTAQAAVTKDQAQQRADQVTQGNEQTNQAQWNQYLASDKAALATAQANNDAADIALYTSRSDTDQANLNGIALQLQELTQTLSNDSYQLTQDQSALSAAQATVNTVKADNTAIASDEARIVTDRAAVATAKTNRTNTITKDKQGIQQAEQQVSSARMSAQSTALATAIKQAPATPATIAQQQASVEQAQISLASAQLSLAETTLRAPAAGTVSAVSGLVGGTASGGGTSSSSSSTSSSSATGTGSGSGSSSSSSSSSGFVSLIGLQGLQVTAAFSESDIANIAVGQPATVTVSALPTEELAAHVIGVDLSGTTSSSVVEYTVTFALDRSEPKLKPGMSASVSVTVAERDNVLEVPSAAVTGSGSNARVTVVASGKQTTTPVVAGLKGDTDTEIVSGVKAGQQVVTSTGATLFSSGGLTSTTSTTGATTRRGGFGGGSGAFLGGGGGFGGGG
jgi:multidrug efflux pump subunit AcrA (membrane-fusion protein)